ncbi:calcium-binding protein [Planktotalea sp.]|uniref:calcium-binding protein n=1 Tax=Planktotalea sp. TaxID=2029877 RepID=UPI003D6A6128
MPRLKVLESTVVVFDTASDTWQIETMTVIDEDLYVGDVLPTDEPSQGVINFASGDVDISIGNGNWVTIIYKIQQQNTVENTTFWSGLQLDATHYVLFTNSYGTLHGMSNTGGALTSLTFVDLIGPPSNLTGYYNYLNLGFVDVSASSPVYSTGTEAADSILGSIWNDSLSGAEGHDTLIGGDGNDRFDGGAGADQIFGEAGKDTVLASEGFDLIKGGGGRDHLSGGKGDDSLLGGKGDDKLYGGKGRDNLGGGKGDDRLFGGKGGDWLEGEKGNDWLVGGLGYDDFIFSDGDGDDTIADFEVSSGKEDINLSAVSEITGFVDLMDNHLHQIDGNVIIEDGIDLTITLIGVNAGELQSDDFIF